MTTQLQQVWLTFLLNLMISKAYEKADFKIVYFDLADVLTNSSVVTTEPATLPEGVTYPNEDPTIPWSDFFQ
jgi:hypothetical protein